jgi:hypothetical protein
MATTETVQVTVTCSGDGIKSKWEPTAMTNSAGVAGGPVKYTMSSGDNTLTVPTGAMGVVLAPPASSAAVLRLKNDAGETGFALRTGQPALIALPTGTAEVLVNASAEVFLYLHWL